MDIKTIRVSKDTLNRIKGYGRYGDTMEDILLRILEELRGCDISTGVPMFDAIPVCRDPDIKEDVKPTLDNEGEE